MVYFLSLVTAIVIIVVKMFTKCTQVIILCFAEDRQEIDIITQVKYVTFLLHNTTIFRKLDSIRKQYNYKTNTLLNTTMTSLYIIF